MTVKRISNQALVEAAALVRMAMLSSLPEPEACGCTFSSEFEKKIEAMRRRAECRNRRKQITHRVAAAIVAVFVGFSLLCALNAEVRAAIRGWIKEVIGDSSYYWFQGEKAEELPYYELTYVPEGYEKILDDALTNSRGMLYQRGDTTDCFTFDYGLTQEDSPIIVGHGGVAYELQEVTINGYRGELYISSDPNNESHGLIWVDDTNGIWFAISAFLEVKDILHIAEGIKLVK
jgi:hypothetical protein